MGLNQNFIFVDNPFHRRQRNFVHRFVVVHRTIPRPILQRDRRSHRRNRRRDRAVDPAVGLIYGFQRSPADIAFYLNFFRDRVDRLSAFGDDRMKADMFIIAERFAQSVDRLQRLHGGIQCVDALGPRTAGMRGQAMNRDIFHDTAVVAPRQLINMLHPRIVEGMDQHAQINVLKITAPA